MTRGLDRVTAPQRHFDIDAGISQIWEKEGPCPSSARLRLFIGSKFEIASGSTTIGRR
jgi:hypothetical protein